MEAPKLELHLSYLGVTLYVELHKRPGRLVSYRVVRTDGILALYSGLSASLCRQMTYSLTRFAIYETVRDRVAKGSNWEIKPEFSSPDFQLRKGLLACPCQPCSQLHFQIPLCSRPQRGDFLLKSL